jgi:hypothetical protein
LKREKRKPEREKNRTHRNGRKSSPKQREKKCENLLIPASPLPFIFVPSAFDKNP